MSTMPSTSGDTMGRSSSPLACASSGAETIFGSAWRNRTPVSPAGTPVSLPLLVIEATIAGVSVTATTAGSAVLASWTAARHLQPTMRPQQGDVLVSSRSSTTDYVVSVVPKRSGFCGSHDEAIAKARDLAEQLRVDVWLTEDRTHFKHIASYRPREDVAPG